VSVLIPVLDEAATLRQIAGEIRAQRFDGAIEYLFVDGGSSDGSREILDALVAEDPSVIVLDNPARRTPQALNLALRAARGEYVVRMDAHTRYPPDYVARGVERLRAGDVDWVSGPQLAEGHGIWSRRVALALSTRLGTGGAGYRHAAAAEHEVDSGFTGLWRRATLERHGGWDEEWLNDQDYELAARIRKAGGRIVCLPELAAAYLPRDSLGALWRQYHRYGFYRVKTSLRHPESLRPSQLLPPALVVTAAAAAVAPRPLRGPARAGVGVYALALAGAGARALAREPARDALSVPLVLATMHVAWGSGFVRGCARLGVPARAVAQAAARLGGAVQRRSGSPLTPR
jgi:succinoglycan biosynthesis protein ExoA